MTRTAFATRMAAAVLLSLLIISAVPAQKKTPRAPKPAAVDCSDDALKANIEKALSDYGFNELKVKAHNGVVTLAGQYVCAMKVTTRLVKKNSCVTRVVNKIVVSKIKAGPPSDCGSRQHFCPGQGCVACGSPCNQSGKDCHAGQHFCPGQGCLPDNQPCRPTKKPGSKP